MADRLILLQFKFIILHKFDRLDYICLYQCFTTTAESASNETAIRYA